MRITLSLLAGAAALFLATTASGMIMDQAGNVTDWGLKPFTQANQADFEQGAIWSTVQNGYAPINYPNGVGHVPSPGGSTGELFDLEEMHLRFSNNLLQVLVVTSSPLTAQAAGGTWYLGDLFVTAGQQRFGIVTQHASQGLTAGGVYRLGDSADTVPLQQSGASYYGVSSLVQNDYGPDDTVRNIAGPWAVKSGIDAGKLLGLATIETATYDYGGAENGTFLIQYNLDLATLGIETPIDLTTQMTWGCGNDVIRVHGMVPDLAPEPATVGLLAFGAVMTWLSQRRAKLGSLQQIGRSCAGRVGAWGHRTLPLPLRERAGVRGAVGCRVPLAACPPVSRALVDKPPVPHSPPSPGLRPPSPIKGEGYLSPTSPRTGAPPRAASGPGGSDRLPASRRS